MPTTLEQFLTLDLAAMLTASFSAITCAVLGNFLLLRRQSLMGDAISHAVLPGLAGAFLITASRGTLPMFLGALAAGVAAALLAELVRRVARIDPGAALGVVFSSLFALGVLLMSLPSMRQVDLDVDCVLAGVLETITWLPDPSLGARAPTTLGSLLDPGVLSAAPRQLVTALGVMLLTISVVVALFKELRLSSFDPALAAALGFRPTWINVLLVVLVACASVAAFEAVGSILVIAMLIVPAACARMLTDKLSTQIALSAVLALVCAVLGYVAGAFAPALAPSFLQVRDSLSAAGMISVIAGVLLVLTIALAPTHGVLARTIRQLRLSISIAREDLLALLYRIEESGSAPGLGLHESRRALLASASPLAVRLALRSVRSLGQAEVRQGTLRLTEAGRGVARSLMRSHRLWERYLVDSVNLRPDHVHRTAMALEHFTSKDMARELSTPSADLDPHGKPIPKSP